MTGDNVAAKSPDSVAPPALGKYAPFARLGHGGMADVFLAVARGPVGFNKLAVVKRLRDPDDAARLEMFLDEARLSARLSHPNIVNTYEVGEAKGQYFIAMEYLDGQPLQAVMKRSNQLDEPTAGFIALQALKGLHYAHELVDYDGTQLHVVHRDVSPHNLFITYQGEVKLLDFGIAKAALNSTHTETGVVKGKIRYMAPEQVAEQDVDRRADVFALGIVLWEMLAGRPLYRGDMTSVLNQIASTDAPLIRSIRAEVSPELEAILARALRRDLGARYPSADAMRIDLERVLRGKQEGGDAALARMLNEMFAETRDAVRARIKTFLGEVPSLSGSASSPNLAQAAELLPSLFGDASGGSGGSGGSGNSGSGSSADSNDAVLASPILSPVAATPASRRRSLWWAVGVATLVAVGTIGAFVLRGNTAREPAPSSTPPRTAPTPVAAVPSTTPVHIETSPNGALVEWNGQPLARTPADIRLPPGSQTLKISRDGYEPEDLTIEVRPQEPTARAVVLRARPEPPPPVSVAAPSVSPPSPTHRTAPTFQAPHPRPQAPPATTPAPTTPTTAAAPTATPPRPKIRVVDDDNP